MSTVPLPLRLGVVGCGAVTELCHLPALARGTPFCVTALVDQLPEYAERAAEQHRRLRNAKGLDEQTTPVCATELSDVFDTIDVAIVATSPGSHAKLAIQLALAGKHVLLEKPIAATIGECVAIREAVASTGVTVLPAHVRRFYPMAAWVAQRLASGQLGTVRRVRWREGAEYGWPAVTGFTFESGAGGGVLADLGPHVLDLLGYWFGPLELQRCEDNSAGGADSESRLELTGGSHQYRGGAEQATQLRKHRHHRGDSSDAAGRNRACGRLPAVDRRRRPTGAGPRAGGPSGDAHPRGTVPPPTR